MSLLSTLDIIQAIFLYFYCSLWTGKCLLYDMTLLIRMNASLPIPRKRFEENFVTNEYILKCHAPLQLDKLIYPFSVMPIFHCSSRTMSSFGLLLNSTLNVSGTSAGISLPLQNTSNTYSLSFWKSVEILERATDNNWQSYNKNKEFRSVFRTLSCRLFTKRVNQFLPLTHLFPMYPFSNSWKHQKTLRFSDDVRA